MEEQEKKNLNFSFNWIFFAPPAIQIVSQVYVAFFLQGIFGDILAVWRDLTHRFWKFLAGLINIDVSDYIYIFDGLTLSLLLFSSAFFFRMRNEGSYLQNEITSDIESKKWIGITNTVIIAFPVSVLIFLMLAPPLLERFSTSSWSLRYLYTILIYFCIMYFAFIICLIINLFFRAGVAGNLSGNRDRVYRALSYSVGLISNSILFIAITITFYIVLKISFFNSEDIEKKINDMVRLVSLDPVLIIGCAFFAKFIAFGMPSYEKMRSDSSVPINIIIFLIFGVLTMFPLTVSLENNGNDLVPLVWVSIIIMSLISTLYLIRTNYVIAINIITVVVLFISVDVSANWLMGILGY